MRKATVKRDMTVWKHAVAMMLPLKFASQTNLQRLLVKIFPGNTR
jgi:hypothetical protein